VTVPPRASIWAMASAEARETTMLMADFSCSGFYTWQGVSVCVGVCGCVRVCAGVCGCVRVATYSCQQLDAMSLDAVQTA
jgi:hypothetical protein